MPGSPGVPGPVVMCGRDDYFLESIQNYFHSLSVAIYQLLQFKFSMFLLKEVVLPA